MPGDEDTTHYDYLQVPTMTPLIQFCNVNVLLCLTNGHLLHLATERLSCQSIARLVIKLRAHRNIVSSSTSAYLQTNIYITGKNSMAFK